MDWIKEKKDILKVSFPDSRLPRVRPRHGRGPRRPPGGHQVGELGRRLAPGVGQVAGRHGGGRQVPEPGGDAPVAAAHGGDGGADRHLEVHVAQVRQHEDGQDDVVGREQFKALL